MNLRNWSFDHTKGMLVGICTPLIFVPIVLVCIAWIQEYYFDQLWTKFMGNTPYRIKIITISIIFNLIWFYLLLNRERFNFAMGIILGSLLYAPYIMYIKFF